MSEVPEILLGGEDPALRATLREILVSAGLACLAAPSREEVLPLLEGFPSIGVAVLDMESPGGCPEPDNGIRLLGQIRQEAFSVKVIVLTGQDRESATLGAVREGAFDVLAKPLTRASILQSVARARLFAQAERRLRAEGFTRLEVSAHFEGGMKSAREGAEETLVRQALRDTGFNIYQSAKRLGIRRENLYYFLRKFGIERNG